MVISYFNNNDMFTLIPAAQEHYFVGMAEKKVSEDTHSR